MGCRVSRMIPLPVILLINKCKVWLKVRYRTADVVAEGVARDEQEQGKMPPLERRDKWSGKDEDDECRDRGAA